jgi:hypothetical protein
MASLASRRYPGGARFPLPANDIVLGTRYRKDMGDRSTLAESMSQEV